MPDRRIRDAYDKIALDPDSAGRILRALEDAASPGEETQNVKKLRKPIQIVVIAAILAVLMAGTAYAVSGVPAATGSHYMRGQGDYKSLADLPKVEKTVGYPVTAVEEFSNGYVFDGLYIGGEAAYDEDYNVIEEYYGVMLDYKKPGAPGLIVNLSPVLDLEWSEAPAPTQTRSVDGVELRLSRDHYKFVPPDYEKTPEDEANMAAGHYYISYGTDEIEEREYAFASFTLSEVEYVLMDSSATEESLDTLAQMAAELIAAAKK